MSPRAPKRHHGEIRAAILHPGVAPLWAVARTAYERYTFGHIDVTEARRAIANLADELLAGEHVRLNRDQLRLEIAEVLQGILSDEAGTDEQRYAHRDIYALATEVQVEELHQKLEVGQIWLDVTNLGKSEDWPDLWRHIYSARAGMGKKFEFKPPGRRKGKDPRVAEIERAIASDPGVTDKKSAWHAARDLRLGKAYSGYWQDEKHPNHVRTAGNLWDRIRAIRDGSR